MRIVYFYDAIARLGGIERIFVEKMNYLAEQYQQEIYLLTTCQGEHLFTYPLSNQVLHIDLGVRFHKKYQYPLFKRPFVEWKMNKKFVTKLKEAIDRIDPDIIIATSIYAADDICKLNCRAKKIIESHTSKKLSGTDAIHRNKIYNILRKRKLSKVHFVIEKKSDVIVTLTNGDASEWNTKNIVVIPNMVDLQNKTYSSLTNNVALFAGRFSYQKGLERMLEAWKLVVNRRPEWVLRLVGEGELKDTLINQCKVLGIEKNVAFAPATADMIEEYCNSSIFLFTSKYEGFGLVLAEAMQCGVPCVSFDCLYGPADIIDDGKNGILVENGNIEEFANAVLKLIDDENLRMEMGKMAMEKAKDYLPDRIMPQWMRLFKRLITN